MMNDEGAVKVALAHAYVTTIPAVHERYKRTAYQLFQLRGAVHSFLS